MIMKKEDYEILSAYASSSAADAAATSTKNKRGARRTI